MGSRPSRIALIHRRTPHKPRAGKVLLSLFSVLILGLIGYGVVFSPFLAVNPEIEGQSLVKKQTIEGLLSSSQKLPPFFSRRIIFFDAEAAEQALKHNPLIKDAVIKKVLPNTLRVSITERKPALTWVSGGKSYLIADDGYVIKEEDRRNVPRVVDTVNAPTAVRERIVTGQFVEQIHTLAQELPAVGLKAVEFSVPETTFEIRVKTDKGFLVYFDGTRDLKPQLKNLETTLAHLARAKKIPKEYILLTVKNKVYIK